MESHYYTRPVHTPFARKHTISELKTVSYACSLLGKGMPVRLVGACVAVLSIFVGLEARGERAHIHKEKVRTLDAAAAI